MSDRVTRAEIEVLLSQHRALVSRLESKISDLRQENEKLAMERDTCGREVVGMREDLELALVHMEQEKSPPGVPSSIRRARENRFRKTLSSTTHIANMYVRREEWLPESEAPQDGSFSLFRNAKGLCMVMNQPPNCYRGVWTLMPGGEWGGSAQRYFGETEFQPLPQAPELNIEEGK